jgi:hypothetical protein
MVKNGIQKFRYRGLRSCVLKILTDKFFGRDGE